MQVVDQGTSGSRRKQAKPEDWLVILSRSGRRNVVDPNVYRELKDGGLNNEDE